MSNHVDDVPNWDAWCWRIWWGCYFFVTAGFVCWAFISGAWGALFGLFCVVLTGLFAFMFWTQWLPERQRRFLLAAYCRDNGLSYWIKKWSVEDPDHLECLPVFHKGDVAWPLRHLIVGELAGLPFQTLDFAYVSHTWHGPRGGIEAGRQQTVLICQVPIDWPHLLLQPRSGIRGAVAAFFIGDTLDYAAIGLQECTDSFPDRGLTKTYRVWGDDPDNLPGVLTNRACDHLLSVREPWTIECLGGFLAIYRPSFLWPSKMYPKNLREVWKILSSFKLAGNP
jgi:hypothetical protein